MRALLRFFFYLLYHPFAFAYDVVAATVSVGKWKDWVFSVLPFIEGPRILEIGHGPGHLQPLLLSRNLFAVGLDESTSMGRLARRRLKRSIQSNTSDIGKNIPTSHSDYTQIRLTRGIAQHLPFPNEFFSSVVATFPSEYITEPETLSEVQRCLARGGRFIVLPVAMLMGRGILDRAMALLFRVTGQSPVDPLEIFAAKFKRPFQAAGFLVEMKNLEVKSSTVLIVIATKP